MDIVIVNNGLGNQMSQYALYMSKKALHQHVRCLFMDTAHNGIELKNVFGIPITNGRWGNLIIRFYMCLIKRRFFFPVNSILSKLNIRFFIETNHSFQPEILKESKGVVFYVGGWHHPSYFKEIDCMVREIYSFPSVTGSANQKIISESCNPNAIALHIRRGDYFEGENYKLYGMVCTDNYYRNAISYMEKYVTSNPIYYVFSNDIDWAKSFLRGRNCVFVNWNKGADSWKDMYLMSQFKNIIIPNSTFSWWAAYLGCKDKIVCRPPFFVNNEYAPGFYLDNWIEISNEDFPDDRV